MSEQEAIKQIVEEVCVGCGGLDEPTNTCSRCGFKLAIADMEKQIPKKPIEEKGETFAISNSGEECYSYKIKCTACGGYLMRIRSFYCPYCGQKLDWSESNE